MKEECVPGVLMVKKPVGKGLLEHVLHLELNWFAVSYKNTSFSNGIM